MFGAARCMGDQLRDALSIMRETTARQDHAATGMNVHWTASLQHDSASNPAVIAEQARHGAVDQQFNFAVQGTAQQACNQGVAVDQLQATSVQNQIASMP